MMMVEQEVLDLLAEEAPPDPENVQVVARLLRSGAAVGSGTGAGAASAKEVAPSTRARESRTMIGSSWCNNECLGSERDETYFDRDECGVPRAKAYLCHATPLSFGKLVAIMASSITGTALILHTFFRCGKINVACPFQREIEIEFWRHC